MDIRSDARAIGISSENDEEKISTSGGSRCSRIMEREGDWGWIL